jgi:DNA-binding MarR family transcriptional regulator
MIKYREYSRTVQSVPEAPPVALAERLGFLLKHTQLALGSILEPALAPLGLDGREFAILAVLASEGPRSQQRLGQRMRVDRTTMVALVDELERKDLVERRRDAGDRRAYAIQVTGKGGRTLERARRVVEDAEAELLAPLTDEERERLREMLAKLL